MNPADLPRPGLTAPERAHCEGLKPATAGPGQPHRRALGDDRMTSPRDAFTAAEQAIRGRYTITGPDVDRRIAIIMGDVKVALRAAAPLIAAAERERIRRLAVQRADEINDSGNGCGMEQEALWEFAKLIEVTA
jgi:hypothetical protein